MNDVAARAVYRLELVKDVAACGGIVFEPMRHSKVSFTIDRYVKVYREDVRDAVQRNDRQQTATS